MNKQIEKNEAEAGVREKTTNFFKISQITGSNYNSLAMFLICINLPKEELIEKFKEIETLVQFDNFVEEFDK